MLTFFKINSFFQVITLLLILFIIRMPFLGNSVPLLTTELEWMLIGEKLNEGLRLYSGILTQVGPLSGFIYQLMDAWVGKNQLVYETTALAIIFFQGLYFVLIINKRNLFIEKNYTSGLFFLILMSSSFDLAKLSPALMANFFILITLNVLLRQIEKRDGIGDDVFEAGLFIGIATLFYLPSFIFIFCAILVLFLYSSINIRQMFMVILAFIMPIFFMYLFFYFEDEGSDFLYIWLFNLRNSFDLSFLGLKDILVVFTLPLSVSIFGIIKVLRGSRYNSFQNRGHQLLIIYGIFSVICLFVAQNFTPTNLVFLVSYLAFFTAGFFIHWKKTFLPEVAFLAFFAVIIFLQYFGVKNILGKSLNSLADYRVENELLPSKFENSKIFITGQHIDAYKTYKMATGYLSWKLAKNDFMQPNNYISLINIDNNFKKDMPEVIIDKEGVMPKIFRNLPELAKKYKATEKNIYELVH